MLIKDIVTQAQDATFANDVKLDAYFAPTPNRELACSYKFTFKVPDIEGKNLVSSVHVLDKLNRCLQDATPNRHVVIATYGHGKSHLALALANFFGKPLDAPEVACMLDNIRIAAGENWHENFRDFKASRPPLLVVCLRGDQAQGLSAQFLQGLETALAVNDATHGMTLSFWFDSASCFLEGLSAEQRKAADEFLREFNIDVADLSAKVRGKQGEYYDLCVRVHQHLFGTRPDFGGEVSLQQAVNRVIEEFCSGPEAKAGGLLILFDEFSAFIDDYAQRRQAGGSGSLQDLLNGVSDHYGKALFVAFSQHDPDTVADNAFRLAGSAEQLQTLHKELTRLPPQQRYNLYSSLETVLDGYLHQPDSAWEELSARTVIPLEDASNNARILLYPRYEDSKGWADGRFEEIITRGCFPLHPLTTGLFCHLEFKNSARRVLQFVLSELESRLEQPAIVNDRPNWVYPIALVDYFNKNLAADREYEEYELARSQAGPEIPEIQKAMLKAVLLFAVGQLQLRRLRFDQAASELTGYAPNQCAQALKELEEAGYLHYNATNKTYQFYAGGRGNKLGETIKKELQSRTLDWNALQDIMEKPGVWTKRYPIDGLALGYSEEWTCPETLLTRSLFTPENIKRLATRFRINDQRNELMDGMRGALIRVIAQNEEEVEWLQSNAERILDEALGTEYPLPVVVAVPLQPRPNLITGLLTLHLLEGWSSSRRAEVGQDAYTTRVTLTKNNIAEELEKLRGWADYKVPQPYRATVVAHAKPDDYRSYLRVCYFLAYAIPSASYRRYFTNRSSSSPPLRKAVALVGKLMASDKMHDTQLMEAAIATDKALRAISADLINDILRVPRWGVIDTTNHTCQPASSSAVLKAWNFLEMAFEAGKGAVPVRQALMPLLNPPYGFDYMQLALLLCAWYGYRRRDLEMTAGVAIRTLDDYVSYLDQPKMFIARLCVVDQARIARRDPRQEERAIRDLLETVRSENGFSRQQVRNHIAQLTAYSEDERADRELRASASSYSNLLQDALVAAEEYARKQSEIQVALKSAAKIGELLAQRKEVAVLPELGKVKEDWPSSEMLYRQIDKRIEEMTEQACMRLETLADITQYAQNQEKLTALKRQTQSLGRADIQERIDTALLTLEQHKRGIEDKRKDEKVIAEVNAMRERDVLHALRDNISRLDKLTAHSEDARDRIKSKKMALEERIRSAEQTVCELQAKADALLTAERARKLKEDVIGEKANYRDTPEYKTLEEIAKRCAELEEFFRLVQHNVEAPPKSPQEATDRISALEAMKQAYQAYLNDNQRAVVGRAQAAVNSSVQTEIQKAGEWLEDREKQVGTTKNLEDLLKQMETPPPFLPSERLPQLSSLCVRVEKKMDENQVSVITARFKRIKDKETLLACLRELQRILEERKD